MNLFDVSQTVMISTRAARRLRQGYLWVYEGDIISQPNDSEPAMVRVLDGSRNHLGFAFYSRRSQIRLRLLCDTEDHPSTDLILRRIRASVARRPLAAPASQAVRLVFAEADLLPSIIVDRYGEYLVLQTLSCGADQLKGVLIELLREELRPTGIVERNDFRARRLEGLTESTGVCCGAIPPVVPIDEAGINYEVDILGGQKTGFFLDQSENRSAAERYARGEALDCFTNTGGFALHFARRCESVTGIDAAAPSIERARRNAALNGFANAVFEEANVFDYLKSVEKAGRRFDMICLDPPAFAKNRSSLAAARGGYKEINLRAMKLLRAEGILITSSCSYHLDQEEFRRILASAGADTKRDIQILEQRSQSSDHPVLAAMPETHYLKCFILRVL